jgi:hypothetical protein
VQRGAEAAGGGKTKKKKKQRETEKRFGGIAIASV